MEETKEMPKKPKVSRVGIELDDYGIEDPRDR